VRASKRPPGLSARLRSQAHGTGTFSAGVGYLKTTGVPYRMCNAGRHAVGARSLPFARRPTYWWPCRNRAILSAWKRARVSDIVSSSIYSPRRRLVNKHDEQTYLFDCRRVAAQPRRRSVGSTRGNATWRLNLRAWNAVSSDGYPCRTDEAPLGHDEKQPLHRGALREILTNEARLRRLDFPAKRNDLNSCFPHS